MEIKLLGTQTLLCRFCSLPVRSVQLCDRCFGELNRATEVVGTVSFWNPQSRSPLPYMPRYHFDVIGRNTIADRTGLLLPDDIHASDAADRLASELYEIRPELRVRECAVLVTDDDGEEVHRAPIIKVH